MRRDGRENADEAALEHQIDRPGHVGPVGVHGPLGGGVVGPEHEDDHLRLVLVEQFCERRQTLLASREHLIGADAAASCVRAAAGRMIEPRQPPAIVVVVAPRVHPF